jgi:hypothetical protein
MFASFLRPLLDGSFVIVLIVENSFSSVSSEEFLTTDETNLPACFNMDFFMLSTKDIKSPP